MEVCECAGVVVRIVSDESVDNVEIERKFLVDSARLPKLVSGTKIKQGYVRSLGGATVRVRIAGGKGVLTLKGTADSGGRRRAEYEYPLPPGEAEGIIRDICNGGIVEKIRYKVSFRGHLWEIDVYEAENRGLFTAEIELHDPDEKFEFPPWGLKEVTEDVRYSNSSLALKPICTW